MKKCRECGKAKKDSEFSFKYKVKNIRGTICKHCQRIYHKKYYEDNIEAYISKAKRNSIRYRSERYKFIVDYLLSHPCIDCGETDPVVLEFDHVNGKKLYQISRMTNHSIENITKEIKKCEVRCANCHKRRHANLRNQRV